MKYYDGMGREVTVEVDNIRKALNKANKDKDDLAVKNAKLVKDVKKLKKKLTN